MNLIKKLHWFIYIIFLFSCARQSSPTGGPRDTIPPVFVNAIPPNQSINFDEKEIQMVFSEDVILTAPKEQLIITPTINKEYKIVYRKNTVTLTLAEPLLDSTTYTFNFREAVQDITEKNPVENLQLAYSTGTYIDSLSIEGTIYNLTEGTPVKDATVALHVENDTFNIFEHPAVYFTKTDDEGNFKISHLKPDNYFLYAFEDKNRNLVVNSRTESYGFISEHQYLLENIKNIPVGLINLDAGPLKISSARPYNTYFNIRTTKQLRTFTLTAVDSSTLSYSFGEDQANIRLYNTTDKDSLQIHFVAIDSIDNAIDTTLYAKYLTREVTPEAFTMSFIASSLLGHTGELNATLQFSKPINGINFDSLYFTIDSLTRVNLTKEDLTWHPLLKQLTITKRMDRNHFKKAQRDVAVSPPSRNALPPSADRAPLKKSNLNELYLGAGAFTSIENDSTEKVVQPLKAMYSEDLAVINMEIRTSQENFLVELLDKTFKVLQQVKNTHKVKFQDVAPGEYQIRLIIDSNANGRWDPGNYFQNTEPEPILYYRSADQSTIIKGVKANWEIGTDGEMFITY